MMFYGNYPFVKLNRKLTRELVFADILTNNFEIPKNPKRSKELIKLVERMLEKNPKKRISWDELFNHPLITLRGSYDNILDKTTNMINS